MFQSMMHVTKTFFNKSYSCQALCSSTYYHFSSKAVDVSYSQFPSDTPSASPPIFILHGILGYKQNWRGLAKAIAKKCQREVYTIDARNHGDSPHSDEFSYGLMSEDVKKLMRELSIAKVTLIGHSMGGRTAMNIALNEENVVEKLVIVDVSPNKMPKSSSIFVPAYMSAMKEAVPLMQDLGIAQARKAVYEHLSKSIPEESIRQFLLTNLTEKDNKVIWKANIDILEKTFIPEICNFNPFSGSFMGDALFVCGGESSYVKTQDHPEIRRLFPKAEFLVIDGAGHWVHSERPKEFLEAVSNFL